MDLLLRRLRTITIIVITASHRCHHHRHHSPSRHCHRHRHRSKARLTRCPQSGRQLGRRPNAIPRIVKSATCERFRRRKLLILRKTILCRRKNKNMARVGCRAHKKQPQFLRLHCVKEVRSGEQPHSLALRLQQGHSLLVEADKLLRAQPVALVGNDAIGEIAACFE